MELTKLKVEPSGLWVDLQNGLLQSVEEAISKLKNKCCLEKTLVV
jgi:hypothetical protein